MSPSVPSWYENFKKIKLRQNEMKCYGGKHTLLH